MEFLVIATHSLLLGTQKPGVELLSAMQKGENPFSDFHSQKKGIYSLVPLMPLPTLAPILITSAIEWVAKHHDEIIPDAEKTAKFVGDVFSQGGLAKTIKQIGNTIIWDRPDGSSHIIGMLDQVDNRIDGLEIGQAALQTGLSGLKSLSMVTLGFSGVSVGLLAAQFMYLNRRFNQIQKATKRIEIKINQTIEAQLQAGLDFLQAADATTGDKRLHNYHDALGRARDAGHFFRSQAVDPNIHEQQLPVIQFYARKYFLALSVELGSLLGLEQTDEVRTRLNAEEVNLKTIASEVYSQTLAADIESYLTPEMSSVTTLENVSDVLEQAQNLGCIPRETKVGPADVFEANRKKIYSGGIRRMVTPSFESARKVAAQKLQIAHGTFEEVTRLLSWREAVGYLTQNNRSPMEIAGELKTFRNSLETPTSSTPFIAYSLNPASV